MTACGIALSTMKKPSPAPEAPPMQLFSITHFFLRADNLAGEPYGTVEDPKRRWRWRTEMDQAPVEDEVGDGLETLQAALADFFSKRGIDYQGVLPEGYEAYEPLETHLVLACYVPVNA